MPLVYQSRGPVSEDARLRRGLPLPVELAHDGRIVRRKPRTGRQGERTEDGEIGGLFRDGGEVGVVVGKVGGGRRAAHCRQQRSAGAADALRKLADGERHAAQQTAALGAEQIRIGDAGPEPLQLDIQIILDREGDGVLQRKVELPGADEGIDARGVAKIDRGDGAGAVGRR